MIDPTKIRLPGVFHQRALIEPEELIARQQFKLKKAMIKERDPDVVSKLETKYKAYPEASFSIRYDVDPGELYTMDYLAVKDDKLIRLDTVDIRTEVVFAYLERHQVSIKQLQGDLTQQELLSRLFLLYDWMPGKGNEGIYCQRVRNHKTLEELYAEGFTKLFNEEVKEMTEAFEEVQHLDAYEREAIAAMPFA